MTIEEIRTLLGRVSCELLGTEFTLLVEHDKKFRMYRGINPEKIDARIYLQVQYQAPCTKTGVYGTWKGGKYYLSSHMTPDEIVKKAYVAFEAAVKHEIMEGFKVDGKILFNPHVHFEALLEVSDREVKREEEPVKVVLIETTGNPFFYKRGNELIGNFYTTDSHPNDKRASHKAGTAKGKMKGLEEVGWIPLTPIQGNLPVEDLHAIVDGRMRYYIAPGKLSQEPDMAMNAKGHWVKHPPCLHMNLAISHDRFKNRTSQICQDCGEETIIQR